MLMKGWVSKVGKRVHKIIGKGKCIYCGKEFDIYSNVPNQKYCSSLCKNRYYRKKDENKVILLCTNCGKEVIRNKGNVKYDNTYCSKECEKEYKYKQKHEIRNCEVCSKEFETLKSSTKRFCSPNCQKEWQKTITGEKHSHFSSEIITCDWCGKEYYEKQYKLDPKYKNHFCSNECRREWYSKVWSQTDEWRRKSQERAVKMLEDGLFNKTETECQLVVNNILNELNIKFINEKGYKSCAVDNYLVDYDLIIEVMGTFWHTDGRFYPTINYEQQVNRIRMDKIKHSYIKKHHDIEILYLWEYDILNNPEICERLINYYVGKKGILDNYHSFNYEIRDNVLLLKNEIITPYMEWEKKNLNKLIDTSVKEKTSKKQEDKWITFNCEYCGKEKEDLISHYKKKEHHFCSIECSSKYRNKKIKVNCFNCKKEIEIITSKFEKQKHFFCNQECQHEYQKEYGLRRTYIEFNCDNCGRLSQEKKREYNKSKQHFCSDKCRDEFKNKNKKVTYFYCDNCGKYASTSNSNYKRREHHFCCHDCSVEWRKQNKKNKEENINGK